jgi:pyruvate dehydrogenase E2 component (dihydrolipoamide acetyltransferase)
VKGTGPHGAITREDVTADAPVVAKPAPDAKHQRAARPSHPGMRGTIAAAMQRSKREIPHYYLETRVDLKRALGWLEDQNRARPVSDRLLPAALLHKAVALAARRVPEMNGYWKDDRFHPASNVHLAIAVSLRGGGLVAPALRDADELPLDDLMRSLRDLVNRARKGRLRSSELGTATLTVTSLGDRGVEKVYGVIHPPQVALVGFGRIVEEPWAEQGMLAVRPVVSATLSADHRASDGYRGARFLAEIRELLGTPEAL